MWEDESDAETPAHPLLFLVSLLCNIDLNKNEKERIFNIYYFFVFGDIDEAACRRRLLTMKMDTGLPVQVRSGRDIADLRVHGHLSLLRLFIHHINE